MHMRTISKGTGQQQQKKRDTLFPFIASLHRQCSNARRWRENARRERATHGGGALC